MSPEFSNDAMIHKHFPASETLTPEEYDTVRSPKPAEAALTEPEILDPQVLVTRLSSESWRSEAFCKGPQRVAFFPPEHKERKDAKRAREKRAKKICDLCVVRSECLNFALENGETFGVWGGTNEVERKELQRRRRFL